MKKAINSITQIAPLPQTMKALHEKDGRTFKRPVVAIALVIYDDSSQGIELMEFQAGLQVKPIADTIKQLIICGYADVEDYTRIDKAPEVEVLDNNPFLNGHVSK